MLYGYAFQQVQISYNSQIQMQSVVRQQTKTVDEYRHNIKLLKYHLKKQQKMNQTLRYKEGKQHKKSEASKLSKIQKKSQLYCMVQTVNELNQRMKEMGLVLGDLFRMADQNYEGEITKEQFMRTILRLKSNLQETLLNEMFYAIDSNLNGMLSSDQYGEFLYAHGGCDSKEAITFQKRSAEKLSAALKKKGIKAGDFLSKTMDPLPAQDMFQKLKDFKLNINESMILLKMWDPSLSGSIRHEVYLKSMENVKQKDEKQIQNEKFQKGVQELCVILRDKKINPIVIFEQCEADGKPGISQFQLEEGLKKLLPEQTTFQIRKWVNLINLNGDSEITREEFISAIKSFYSIQQISNFSSEYQKLHPNLKNALNVQEVPAQKIINQLSIAIEDNGLTKTEVFHRIDINHNGLVDKEELLEGLKHLGINIGLIAKVLTVFDRDASGQISLDQWLNILGEDVQMEEVSVPTKVKEEPTKKAEKKQVKKQAKKQQSKKQAKKQQIKKQPKKQQIKKSTKKQQVKVVQKDQKKQLNTSTLPSKKQSSPGIQKKNTLNIPQNTSVISKKAEPLKDQNKATKQPSKIKESNSKSPKKAVRPPSKLGKTPYAEDRLQSQQSIPKSLQDNEEEKVVNVEEIEREVGELYGKSKKKVLTVFKGVGKSKKGLNEKELSKCLNQLRLKASLQDDQVKAIFEGNISSNGTFQYQQWLQLLLQNYNIEAVQQKEPLEEIKSPQKKAAAKERQQPQKPKPSSKPVQQKIIDESQLPSKSNIERYSESFENDSKVLERNAKRGQNHKQFQDIGNLVVQNQVHTDEGYKFSTYIGSDQQLNLLNNKYIPVSKSLKEKKKIYKDSSFPTNLASLTDNPSQSKIQNVTLLKWKHYSQLYKQSKLFDKGIEPNDIVQGELGDCYFLCSLSSLAQYHRLIQRIFQYYDVDNGYFLIWLCLDGVWKLIEVDGYIPVKPDGKAAVFSRSREGDEELWVMLLEKAYAKAYGCYEHIIGGQPYEAIKDLTGAPGQSFSHKNKSIDINLLWEKLTSANQAQFIMTCGTDQSEKGQFKLQQHSESVTTEGIVIGHAYSILGMSTYKGQKLIQLRNPWGTMEWNGAWSDKSSKWTPQAKAALKYTDQKDDGIFWMPYETFYKYYATTAINYIRPNYFYTSERKIKIKNLVVKIQSSALKHGFIMVAQGDHRKRGLAANTAYNVCHIIAINFKQGKVIKKIQDQKYMYQREGSVEINSNEAEANSQFIIMINLQNPTDINLCTYANVKFTYDLDDSFDSMLNYIEAIASIQENAKNVQTDDKKTFKSWLTSVGQYAFLVFKNIGNKQLNLGVDLKQPSNLKLLNASLSIKMSLKPNCTETIKGKIENLKQPFSFGPMGFSYL